MPVRNTAEYLRECLESILQQSHTQWELWAIDDHSDDESPDILEAYSAKDSRIHYLPNQGKGIIPALRLAYMNSRGNLITRMDSDDKMAPTKLESMKDVLLEKGKGHLAVGLVEYFSNLEMGQGYLRYAEWLNGLTSEARNFSEIYKECVIPSPCWMIHRSDLDTCGAFAPDTYPEDYDLCFRFMENELKIAPVKQILHFWRDHNSRASRNDPNYLDNRFTPIKVKYFIRLHYSKKEKLFLWGAGKKGKNIAKEFIRNNVPFEWVCDNKNKIGKDIYDVRLQHYDVIPHHQNTKIIVSVSSPEGIIEIKKWLEQHQINTAYFFS